MSEETMAALGGASGRTNASVPPVISPIKKGKRLGPKRSLVKKSTDSSRSNGPISHRARRLAHLEEDKPKFFFQSFPSPTGGPATVDEEQRHKELQEQFRRQHNKEIEVLWDEQKAIAKKKHEAMATKKLALDVFRQLHELGEARYDNEHEEMQRLYHTAPGAAQIDFETFYQCLQDHYFGNLISRQKAKNIFGVADKDKTGQIDFKELHNVYESAVRTLGAPAQKLTKDEIRKKKEQDKMEMNRTQKALLELTNDEMILRKNAVKRMNELKYKIQEKMLPKVKTSLENTLRETYNLADVNGDGNLSYEEFADWLGDGPTGLNVGFTKNDIRDVTLACDVDLDGGISVDEFIEFVTRKNKLDPRSFLNDSRADRVDYMKSLRSSSLENMRKKAAEGNTSRSVDTDHSYNHQLSTRLWDDDTDGFLHPLQSPEGKTLPRLRRLGQTHEEDLEKHIEERGKVHARFYALNSMPVTKVREDPGRSKNINSGPSYTPKRSNIKRSFSSPTLSARSSTLRRLKHRGRRQRKNGDTSVDIGSAEHHQLPGGNINALYSQINLENMANEMFTGRWDGRGKDHKPDWVQRLTFNRVNMGGDDGVLPGSSMYQKESERRKHITNKNARTTNPAGKLVDDWTRNKKHDERLKFVRQRMYLRKNRRATRTKVKEIAHAQKKADNSRIFNKTCQQLRYLEVLQAVEDRVINNSYLTKGMITSPQAAKMKQGSINFFRPPSAGARQKDALQTGIGTRSAAIVHWSY